MKFFGRIAVAVCECGHHENGEYVAERIGSHNCRGGGRATDVDTFDGTKVRHEDTGMVVDS